MPEYDEPSVRRSAAPPIRPLKIGRFFDVVPGKESPIGHQFTIKPLVGLPPQVGARILRVMLIDLLNEFFIIVSECFRQNDHDFGQ